MVDENILVEFDKQNIIVVDPNKLIDDDGNVIERNVQQENLVYYANLECNLTKRTILSGDESGLDSRTISIAKMNFLKPVGKDYFTTTSYDVDTGGKQIRNTNDGNQGSIDNETETIDSELLGITQITINNNLSLLPTVDIQLEDIRGRALFELGDNSPYATFFNLPYPVFFLTIKGYYGKAVKYQLALRTFNARFDTATGNFKIDLKFLAYKFNVLNTLTMNVLHALPFMYEKELKISNSNNNSNELIQTKTSLGYEKIKEVYSDYKSKGLLPQSFPELTYNNLITRLENLETNINNSFSEVDMQPLSDGNNYQDTLNNYLSKVYSLNTSWARKYLSSSENDKIYLKNGNILQKIKEDQITNIPRIEKELLILITDYNKFLGDNRTFGKNGKYEIQSKNGSVGVKEIPTSIVNNININLIKYSASNLNENDIDFDVMARNRGQENNAIFKRDILNQITANGDISYYVFEGGKSFQDEISKMGDKLRELTNKIETDLSEVLSEQLTDINDNGLGFIPTLRNIVAVILANSEAFLRLMNYVHDRAWDKREHSNRVRSILNNQDNIVEKNNKIVYPWPQFVVKDESDKQINYVLAYPGDPKYISLTGANNKEVWPEVEFIEEYLSGLVKIKEDKNGIGFKENLQESINVLSLLSMDFPPDNIIYGNKEEVKFYYEIYERIFSLIKFNYLSDDNLIDIITDIETQNIKNSVNSNSPFLLKKLKEYGIGKDVILSFLRSISNNGVGESWQRKIRGYLTTPYLEDELSDSFKIYESDSINIKINATSSSLDKLNTFIGRGSNDSPLITNATPVDILNNGDTFLANGINNRGNWFKTNRVLQIHDNYKIISNFNNGYTSNQIRPFTTFGFLNSTIPQVSSELSDFSTYYSIRRNNDLLFTEGFIAYDGSYSGNVGNEQTTTIFNTPMFINSIQEGVNNDISDIDNAYVSAAFLFLNSLPLSTLREKYIDNEQGYLDYISATLKKYGAIHRLPYSFLLKIGSIWHRYKRWINDGVDIIDNVWKDFDAVANFDPQTSDANKTYQLTFDSNGIQEDITFYSRQNDLYTYNFGFYPKLINDFYYFYTNSIILTGYTDIDIQKTIGGLINIGKNVDSNFIVPNYKNGGELNVRTFYTTINSNDDTQYIVPSFGSPKNQSIDECFINGGEVNNYIDNKSVINGTINYYWGSSNFGYFDLSSIQKPSPKEHFKLIYNSIEQQDTFRLSDKYTSIEDLFSVFDKTILDKFENEFLNFSKSELKYQSLTPQERNGITGNITLSNTTNEVFRNFQRLMKDMFGVDRNSYDIKSITTKLNNKIKSKINGFINYDVVVNYGNPQNYNERVFKSLNKSSDLVDKIQYDSFIPGTIPGSLGVTLLESRTNYPNEWKTLETYVGFSDIEDMVYSDNGSTITDFFSDLNMRFNVENIINFAPIIKIYAKQKKINPSLTGDEFIIQLSEFDLLQNDKVLTIMSNVLSRLNKELPNVADVTSDDYNSMVISDQDKLQEWERYKSLNDTWVAGNNYTETTLFEDVLFIDRANRNIGDDVLIDPYKTRMLLNNVKKSASVYHYLSSLIIEHNFFVQMLPSYINFYNVQEVNRSYTSRPEGSLEFANNLFGTFLNVDTRESSPKLLCTYIDTPSAFLDIKKVSDNNFVKVSSDSLGLDKTDAYLDNLDGKEDYNISNKVVGFNVDIGIRNQNIFHYFDVSQDLGKQTSESIATTVQMIDRGNGKQIATQNVGLWDIYLKRSYKCRVQSMGNAMIQPTMYFNLRYVPMFNGPYYITDVTHTMTPGNFETTFEGVRQSIFGLPKPKDLIKSLRQNLFKQTKDKLFAIRKDCDIEVVNDSETAENNNVETDKCVCLLDRKYLTYEPEDKRQTTLSLSRIKEILNENTTPDKTLRYYIFSIMYIWSYNKDNREFNGWNNNFINFKLSKPYGGDVSQLFNDKFICVDDIPLATFDTSVDFITFCRNYFNYINGNQIDGVLFFSRYVKQYLGVTLTINSNTSFQDLLTSSESIEEKRKNVVEKLLVSVVAKKIDEAIKLANQINL